MKTNSIGRPFTIEKILKIDFQNFHISWKASKIISWAFLGSLHNETNVKYVFHEMFWKKYLTLYGCFNCCTMEGRANTLEFSVLRRVSYPLTCLTVLSPTIYILYLMFFTHFVAQGNSAGGKAGVKWKFLWTIHQFFSNYP